MEGNNKGLTWFLLLLFKKKKWGEWGRQREKGRIRWKKRRWFKLLMALKQTEFGNQFLSDSWFGRTSLVWIKEIGKKKKEEEGLVNVNSLPTGSFSSVQELEMLSNTFLRAFYKDTTTMSWSSLLGHVCTHGTVHGVCPAYPRGRLSLKHL